MTETLATKTFTYRTRLYGLTAVDLAQLDAYAALYGQVERKLFAAAAAGQDVPKLKSSTIDRYGITARQFNAIAAGLKGKMSSITQRRDGLLKEAEQRIKKAEAVIKRLAKKPKAKKGHPAETAAEKRLRLHQLHQKRRRLATRVARHARMKDDAQASRIRLAFGSNRLFSAQFDLEANALADHAAWREQWRDARSSQFMVIGSKDETAGCQGCVATVHDDDGLSLRLRLPDCLVEQDKYLTIDGVRFAYGHAQVLAALGSSKRFARTTSTGKTSRSLTGTAITYRFVRDAKGWSVLASVAVDAAKRVSAPLKSASTLGAIGVDINADHLAVAQVDRHGNLVEALRIDTIVYGKTGHQRTAVYGDAVKEIVELAARAGKPIVLERLDFSKKKAELEDVDRHHARLLSAMAYRQASEMIQSAAHRRGVEVVEVNPAYTSVIGAVNHARRFGISVHMGAALAIARRAMGLSERPSRRIGLVPVRNGGHVTIALPARNRAVHVWSHWAGVRRALRASLAGYYRSAQAKATAPPLTPFGRPACASGFDGATPSRESLATTARPACPQDLFSPWDGQI